MSSCSGPDCQHPSHRKAIEEELQREEQLKLAEDCSCHPEVKTMQAHVKGHPPGHPFCTYEQSLAHAPGVEDPAARGDRLAKEADAADARGETSLGKVLRLQAARSLMRAEYRGKKELRA